MGNGTIVLAISHTDRHKLNIIRLLRDDSILILGNLVTPCVSYLQPHITEISA